MELVNVTQELYAATRRLNEASRKVFRLAEDKARSEQTYRRELAKRIITLRSEKMPVSIIADVARGDIADLKFARDLASDMYRAGLSSMEATKAEINALQTIARYQSDI